MKDFFIEGLGVSWTWTEVVFAVRLAFQTELAESMGPIGSREEAGPG